MANPWAIIAVVASVGKAYGTYMGGMAQKAYYDAQTDVAVIQYKEKRIDAKLHDLAIANGRKKKKNSQGLSAFDCDLTVGVSENFVFATKGGKKRKISSGEWPFVGEKLVEEGWKMDFTDFNKVTNGKPGPFFNKMKNQIQKFGAENVFILTARAPESTKAKDD